MGQQNGKNEFINSDAYMQQQLQLFKWRADTSSNAHIARVQFSSKHSLVNKERLQMLLAQQLQSKAYVDVAQMMSLSKGITASLKDQAMTFETYAGDLTITQDKLTLEQNLYVLEVLLRGYEAILHKLGKVHIAPDCCFVTEEGEVRAWINPTPISNDCPPPPKRENKLEGAFQTSQVGAVREIIKLSEHLATNSSNYAHFLKKLESFLDRDVLHHLNFASVRKFINNYIYTYRLNLPTNLLSLLARLRHTQSTHCFVKSPHQNMNSSLAELIEDREYSSKPQLASTGANLQPHNKPNQYQSSQNQKSHQNQCQSSQFQFYRPSCKKMHEKKLSTADLPYRMDKDRLQKQLSRSEMVSKKDLDEEPYDISNSFRKKEYNYYDQDILKRCNLTPKSQNLCDSTALCSLVTHSKEQSGLTYSKAEQSYSTLPLHEATPTKPGLQKKVVHSRYVNFYQQEEDRQNQNHQYMNYHSKQPSFDDNSSPLFLNPTHDHQHKSQTRDKGQSGRLSTIGQKSQSNHLSRQVSGLLSNELSLHESQGSFTSMESGHSHYKGMLMKMGRSAKLVSIPSCKKVGSQFKGTTYPNLARMGDGG